MVRKKKYKRNKNKKSNNRNSNNSTKNSENISQNIAKENNNNSSNNNDINHSDKINQYINKESNNNSTKNNNLSEKIVQNANKKNISNNNNFNINLNNNPKNSSYKPKGLVNLGLSCYMNSILQCFFHIKKLREFFILNKNNFDGEKQPISQALSEVMYELKYGEDKSIRPEKFKAIIAQKNSLFLGRKAGDAKDLFFNLIDGLLDELKNINSNEDSCLDEPDLSNKLEIYNETKKEIDNNIINQIFIGIYETIYECPINKKNIYSFQIESFILFDLENIKKYYKKEDLSLDLCFQHFIREQQNSSFFCSLCNDTQVNKSINLIYDSPEILTIILDRGHGKTFRGAVHFDIEINLKKYIDKDKNKEKKDILYKLICINTHSGDSSSTGHYTSCCLNDNGKYYYFSDSFVKEIKDLNELYNNEPYILFYKKIDNNNDNNYYKDKEISNNNDDNEINIIENNNIEELNNNQSNYQNINNNNDIIYNKNTFDERNNKFVETKKKDTNNAYNIEEEKKEFFDKNIIKDKGINEAKPKKIQENKNKIDNNSYKQNLSEFNNNEAITIKVNNNDNSQKKIENIKNNKTLIYSLNALIIIFIIIFIMYILLNNFEIKNKKLSIFGKEEQRLKSHIQEVLNKFIKENNQKYVVNYYESEKSHQEDKDPLVWALTINGPNNTIYDGLNIHFKIDFKRLKLFEMVYFKFFKRSNYHLNFFNKKNIVLFEFKYDSEQSLYLKLLKLFNFIYDYFVLQKTDIWYNDKNLFKLKILLNNII